MKTFNLSEITITKKIFKIAVLSFAIGFFAIPYSSADTPQNQPNPPAPTLPFEPNLPVEKTAFSCSVPSQNNLGPKIYLTLTEDTSADFISIYLIENNLRQVYFLQHPKNSFKANISAGGLIIPVMSEESNQTENGVLENAGILTLQKTESNGVYAGALAAKGNVYIMACGISAGFALQKPKIK